MLLIKIINKNKEKSCEKFSKLDDPEIYIINLARSKDRRENVQKYAKVNGININIFEAIDGYKHELTYKEKYLLRNANYDIDDKKGVMGCALSHYYLWKELLQHKGNNFVICEDDVRFDSQFNENLKKVIENKEDYDIIFLCHTMRYRDSNRYIQPLKSPYWFGAGSTSYLISKKGLNKLLNLMENGEGMNKATDWLIYFTCKKIKIGILTQPIVQFDDNYKNSSTISTH